MNRKKFEKEMFGKYGKLGDRAAWLEAYKDDKRAMTWFLNQFVLDKKEQKRWAAAFRGEAYDNMKEDVQYRTNEIWALLKNTNRKGWNNYNADWVLEEQLKRDIMHEDGEGYGIRKALEMTGGNEKVEARLDVVLDSHRLKDKAFDRVHQKIKLEEQMKSFGEKGE